LSFSNNDYFQNVVLPTIFTRSNSVEQLVLPMIDKDFFSKKDSVPPFLYGLLWKNWEPTPEDGNTLFLKDYRERGVFKEGTDNEVQNLAKRVYFSAVTPELYDKYSQKVTDFFGQLLDDTNAGKPLMAKYVDTYWNLYWALHLGISNDCKEPEKDVTCEDDYYKNCIPPQVKEIGNSFVACIAEGDVFSKNFRENYENVRQHQDCLKKWVEAAVERMETEISDGSGDDTTFVYYWLKNREGDEFKNEDVTFECYHDFVALSQWGHTIYRIMEALIDDKAVRSCFDALKDKPNCGDDPDVSNSPFTPLDRFVMELFRTRSPNGGSLSSQSAGAKAVPTFGAILTTHKHKEISADNIHWSNPSDFDPERYIDAPTSAQIDNSLCGNENTDLLKECPFPHQDFHTHEGTTITNNGFGTVYSKEKPVCDTAGYAPFGLGYRRCPGEQFTIEVIKQFLKTVCKEDICFSKNICSDNGDLQEIPIAPGTIIQDDICFGYNNNGECQLEKP
jgi:hypothetical protein